MSTSAEPLSGEFQRQLIDLDKSVGVPDFVKNATVDELKAPSTSRAYADVVKFQLPCHTKAAAWLSNAEFQQTKSEYSTKDAARIQAQLDKMAEYWQIQAPVQTFNQKFATLQNFSESDLPDDAFALVLNADGMKLRRMPMISEASIKTAAHFLFRNRFNYTYDMRKTAATRILKKAEQDKVGLLDDLDVYSYLHKAAGYGAARHERVAESLAQRALMLTERHYDEKVKYAELAEQAKFNFTGMTDWQEKLASVIDGLDRETGICNYYKDQVDMPEEICFNVLEKDAAEILDNHVALQNGTVLKMADILQIPVEKIASVLGQDVADALSYDNTLDRVKVAAVVPTFPRPDAVLLTRLVEEWNKEASKPGFDKEARRTNRLPMTAYSKASMLDFFKDKGTTEEHDFKLNITMDHPQSTLPNSKEAAVAEPAKKNLRALAASLGLE